MLAVCMGIIMIIDNNVRNIIEKYIYDVVRRLPQGQRRDIELELGSIIEDMIEASDGGNSVEDILKRLGTPSELARKYRGEGAYLIGPEYYEQYRFVLKIVMICNLAGAIIGLLINVISGLGDAEISLRFLIKHTTKNLTEPIVSMVSAFGIVTLIFAIIERQKLKIVVNLADSNEWSVSSLPEIPTKKALLSRGESALELVFSLVVFGVFAFAPQLIGVWIKEGAQYQSIPIFNLEIWTSIFPLFWIWIVLCIIEAIIKLIVGRHGMVVAITSTIINVLAFGVSVLIFKFTPIWNPNFVTELELAFDQSINGKADLLTYWGTDVISNILLGIMFFAIVLEMGITFYKSIKYGDIKK